MCPCVTKSQHRYAGTAGWRQAAGVTGFRAADAQDFITAPGSWLRRGFGVWSRQARFAMMV